ncbi:hypothetical protein DPMN_013461 [Dreissena polymorpha]|uniref:Uncharacterized protein n=2 Tax=Dreissena polymorpha TaxID=45954 RepID=A0A9D4N9X2_DREPO|nr:hypothetical protein DPMN_013461 [Dreissena polymorpha]
MLLTLASDGSLLSTFTDPKLLWPRAVHVTAAGQVFVCGCMSNTIVQVCRDRRQKLATLPTGGDGVSYPASVYYNRKTSSIIVGRGNNNKILVLNVVLV